MTTHAEDAHSLEGDGIVELFEIYLLDGAGIFLKNNESVTWQGKSYEGIALQLSGVGQYSDEENARPNFVIANPEGMFSTMVRDGALDGAFVYRYRVLRADLEADLAVYKLQGWRVRRVSSLTRHKITLEMRDQLDGQFFQTPARMFIPPEYKQVSLG